MGDRRIYFDEDKQQQYYIDDNGEHIYITVTVKKTDKSIIAAIISGVFLIVAAFIGVLPIFPVESSSGQIQYEPPFCLFFNNQLIDSVLNCGNQTDETRVAVEATLTAIASTPNIVETSVAETLTAIATSATIGPGPSPSYTSTLSATATNAPTNTPLPSPTPQPTILQISCDNPQAISASQSTRLSYTQYHTDLYNQCGWSAVWTALANGGSVSGSVPAQRQQTCRGEGYTQNDAFSCRTSFGIDAYILDPTQEIIVRDPHCIIYAPSSSRISVTQLPDYKEENRGSDRVVTNVRVTGHFTFYIWCIASWE